MANGNDIQTWDRGELVTTIGPLSIFRTAAVINAANEDGSSEAEPQVEHRYTVRVDPAWVLDGNIVAFELEPPYFAVETGSRLDSVDSLVEFMRNPESENPEISVLVLESTTKDDQGSFNTALNVRCEQP
jgi:hypothetical protein